MKFNYERNVVLGAGRIDLCSTCDNAETCDMPIRKRRLVLECDQFTVTTPPEPAVTLECVQKGPKVRSAESIKLCDDCRNRTGCTFPEYDNHLWECAEYR